MLIRIVLAIEKAEERKRLRGILQNLPNLVVQTARGRKPSWNRLAGLVGDLLVVSRSIVPEPVRQHLATLREIPDAPEIVVMCSPDDSEDQAQLLAAGCYAVLDSTISDELLHDTLETVISRRGDEVEAKLALPQDIGEPRLSDFVSKSPAMQAFMEVVHRVVNSDTTLLLVGETGVGKERLGQAIHAESPRSQGPFVAVNCGAIPEALLESELFGHTQGAFTGATRTRRGWFELAHSGTIFLDEIAEMPPHLQLKLLRVLQTREVIPVGAETSIKVDVRVMAATNQNLDEEVKSRRFRQDLYYRLCVVSLEIPALRERKDDIASLAERYIQYFQSKLPTSVQSISDQTIAVLTEYDWPGNVREFVNVIERALLLCPGDKITLRDIPDGIKAQKDLKRPAPTVSGALLQTFQEDWLRQPLREVRRKVVENVERGYLHALLEETNGRVDQTAKRAGLNTRNLFDKMRQYGLKKEDYRKRE